MARNEYHYVITLQFDRAGGLATQTTTGIVTAGGGSTREGLYHDVYKFACEKSGLVEREATVLFFTMGRNDLSGDEAQDG